MEPTPFIQIISLPASGLSRMEMMLLRSTPAERTFASQIVSSTMGLVGLLAVPANTREPSRELKHHGYNLNCYKTLQAAYIKTWTGQQAGYPLSGACLTRKLTVCNTRFWLAPLCPLYKLKLGRLNFWASCQSLCPSNT
jgi:hypothetical protein